MKKVTHNPSIATHQPPSSQKVSKTIQITLKLNFFSKKHKENTKSANQLLNTNNKNQQIEETQVISFKFLTLNVIVISNQMIVQVLIV
jgi:hypothetical protein